MQQGEGSVQVPVADHLVSCDDVLGMRFKIMDDPALDSRVVGCLRNPIGAGRSRRMPPPGEVLISLDTGMTLMATLATSSS